MFFFSNTITYPIEEQIHYWECDGQTLPNNSNTSKQQQHFQTTAPDRLHCPHTNTITIPIA